MAQGVQDEAPAAEKVPAGQAEQAVTGPAPVMGLARNVPAGHCVQVLTLTVGFGKLPGAQ